LSAKLPIARAAMPMFSPSCGSTRITAGPARSGADFVLSVPDITSLSASTSEDFESGLRRSDPTPSAANTRLPVRHHFSSEFIGLVTGSEFRLKPQPKRAQPLA